MFLVICNGMQKTEFESHKFHMNGHAMQFSVWNRVWRDKAKEGCFSGRQCWLRTVYDRPCGNIVWSRRDVCVLQGGMYRILLLECPPGLASNRPAVPQPAPAVWQPRYTIALFQISCEKAIKPTRAVRHCKWLYRNAAIINNWVKICRCLGLRHLFPLNDAFSVQSKMTRSNHEII